MDLLNNLVNQCLNEPNEAGICKDGSHEIVNLSSSSDSDDSNQVDQDPSVDPASFLSNPILNPHLKNTARKPVKRGGSTHSMELAKIRALEAIKRGNITNVAPVRPQAYVPRNHLIQGNFVYKVPAGTPIILPKGAKPVQNTNQIPSSNKPRSKNNSLSSISPWTPPAHQRFATSLAENQKVYIKSPSKATDASSAVELTTDERLEDSASNSSADNYFTKSCPQFTEKIKTSEATVVNQKRVNGDSGKRNKMLPYVFQLLPNVTQVIAEPKAFEVPDAPIYGRVLTANVRNICQKKKQKFEIEVDFFNEMFPDPISIHRTPAPYKVGNIFKIPDKEDVEMVTVDEEMMPVVMNVGKPGDNKEQTHTADDGEYEVEKVLMKNIFIDKQPHYLLKWAGYGYNELTWEKEASLGCMELIRDFVARRSVSAVLYNSFEPGVREHYSGFLNKYVSGLSDSVLMDACIFEGVLDDFNKKNGHAKLLVENWTDDAEYPLSWKPLSKCIYTSESTKAVLKVKPEKKPCSCSNCAVQSCKCMTVRIDHGYIHANINVITECSDICDCNVNNCPPHVFAKGRQVELILFKNHKSGWGLRAFKHIKEGKFITEYIGLVRTAEESKHIEDMTYLFELDFNGKPKYLIDATEYGNEARFINHSCDPNLSVVMCFGAMSDPCIYKIYFFAKRDILAGEELTFNYYGERAPPTEVPSNVTRCNCGASVCRQYLY